jgi:type II secretory pathway component PulM
MNAAVPQYQDLYTTTPTTTPTPTCRPCRNRGMLMLLAVVLLAAIVYLIFYGDNLFKEKKVEL